MIYAAKILADGQLPMTKGAIYTARADAFITTIKYVNNNAGGVVVNLYLNHSGTGRRMIPKDMAFGGHFMLETDEPFTMQSGDTLEADSNTDDVDFLVLGGLLP